MQDIFYNEIKEPLDRAAQQSCECPIAGSVQGQDKQPDLVKDVPPMARGLDKMVFKMSLPIQTTLTL